jgi:uroporphyrinogen decarboxylase
MDISENIRRAVRFEKPDWIPVIFHINPACWFHYPHEALQALMAEHPLLFPDYTPMDKIVPDISPVQRRNHPFRDPWGCVWTTREEGITGTVTEHPLADWQLFDVYIPPNPEITDGLLALDWGKAAQKIANQKAAGELVQASLPHGHTFLRLCDIRGYENLVMDMFDNNHRLGQLIEMIESFNLVVVNHFIELGVEWIGYPEDLGMQVGPMITPAHFRQFIAPVYRRLVRPARRAGCMVHMHSDGDIRVLIDDLLACGVEVFNLQDLVNGIDWIADKLKGRVCIDLDVDRQKVTPYGTPAQIDALIREAVQKLGSPQGGLMMIYGLYPGVPLPNVKALMDAMEKYAAFYS